MTDQEKEQLYPGGAYVLTGFDESGRWRSPMRVRYLTPAELKQRRRERNRGLFTLAALGFGLGLFFDED